MGDPDFPEHLRSEVQHRERFVVGVRIDLRPVRHSRPL
jgi:hypothetical protein